MLACLKFYGISLNDLAKYSQKQSNSNSCPAKRWQLLANITVWTVRSFHVSGAQHCEVRAKERLDTSSG